MYKKGQTIKVWDKETDKIEDAELIDTRYNVKSSFDDYIYPTLYDVRFLHNNRISKGHLNIQYLNPM